jgi:hypothetical protein
VGEFRTAIELGALHETPLPERAREALEWAILAMESRVGEVEVLLPAKAPDGEALAKRLESLGIPVERDLSREEVAKRADMLVSLSALPPDLTGGRPLLLLSEKKGEPAKVLFEGREVDFGEFLLEIPPSPEVSVRREGPSV